MTVAVIDTGVANLHSVTSALARLGADCRVIASPSELGSADRAILPGVGSAPAGMASLRARGFLEPLADFDRPLLGICLGMQMMFETLDEGSLTKGLGLFGGTVSKLANPAGPLPHMGWNQLAFTSPDPFLDGVADGSHVYFVHSFAAPELGHTLATATYGERFTAIIRDGNRIGCQFHPERSGAVGHALLRNFLEL